MKTKHCYKCDRTLPIIRFSKNRSRKDGLNSRCKACVSAYNQQYQQIPEVKARRRAYTQQYNQSPERRIYKQRYRRQRPEIYSTSVFRRKYQNDCIAGITQLQCCCENCGEQKLSVLEIHHRNGDGAEHRKQTNGNNARYYRSIINSDFDHKRFQVLCESCHKLTEILKTKKKGRPI